MKFFTCTSPHSSTSTLWTLVNQKKSCEEEFLYLSMSAGLILPVNLMFTVLCWKNDELLYRFSYFAAAVRLLPGYAGWQ